MSNPTYTDNKDRASTVTGSKSGRETASMKSGEAAVINERTAHDGAVPDGAQPRDRSSGHPRTGYRGPFNLKNAKGF